MRERAYAGYDLNMRSLLCVVLFLLLNSVAAAADRSRAIRSEFQRLNPCPVNGATRGACPGFEVDHVIALCSGGRDEVANLEWRTREDHALQNEVRHNAMSDKPSRAESMKYACVHEAVAAAVRRKFPKLTATSDYPAGDIDGWGLDIRRQENRARRGDGLRAEVRRGLAIQTG